MGLVTTGSLLVQLRCSGCGKAHPANQLQTFCQICQAPLFAVYDLARGRKHLDREEFARRPRGMWRWREFLPVVEVERIVSLGEGDAPLLKADRLASLLGLKRLFIKDESLNPTGSFKARGLSAAISKAYEFGVEKAIIPTAGNAGGALAAYAARCGMRAAVYLPMDTPRANVEETRITGAEVVMVDGLINDAARLAGERAQSEDWFDVSTFKEPYRCEGKKIMGYELAEAFGWLLPDVIIYPTGGGTGLVGMVKAFAEMEQMGWLEDSSRPRMVAVQADGCAPVVKAFKEEALKCDVWIGAHTIASGLRVPKSFADQVILDDLRKSRGTAVAVSDAAILEAQKTMAEMEGIFAAPEGAATLSALQLLIQEGWVHADERIVLFNTGSGLKYLG